MAVGAGAVRAGRAFVEISADSSKLAGGLKAIDAKMQKVGGSSGSMGSQMAGLGTAVAGTVAGAIGSIGTVFAGFDSKMSEVAAVSGATGGSLDALRDKAKELGAATKFSATQAADAMKYLGMAGMNDKQILAAIGPVLNTAAAGMMDLGRAADIVSDATTAFGLSAEDTGRVADVMAKTATSSNTSIEQMGQAFVYAAAQGKAAGQTIEDVSAALGILGNSGLKASIAGTGVQGIFKRMVQPRTAKALADLGINAADAAGNFKPLTKIIDELRFATEGMTQVERSTQFEKMFGQHAKTAVILVDNADALRKMTGELYESGGAAEKMAKIMSDNLTGAWLGFRSSIEGVTLALGEALDGPMTAVVAAATGIARGITKAVTANKGLITSLGGGLMVVGALGAAVATLGGGLMFTGVAISTIGTAVGALGAVVGVVMTPVAGLVALGVAGLSAMAVGMGVVAQQSGLLAPAINFLGDAFGRLWAITSATFGGILNALKGGDWGKAAEIGWAGVKLATLKGAQFVLQGVEGLWNNVGTITTKFLGSLMTTMWNAFSAIPKLVWSALKGGMSFTQILADALGGALTGKLDLASKLQPSIDAAKADLVRLNNSVAPRPGEQQQQPPVDPRQQEQQQRQAMYAQMQQQQRVPNLVPPGVANQFRGVMPQAMAAAAPAMAMAGGGGSRPMQQGQAGGELGQLLGVAVKQLQMLVKIYEEGGM